MDHTPLEVAQQVAEKHATGSVELRSEFGDWMRRVLLVLLLTLHGLLIWALVAIDGVANFQEEGKERGFINRAAACRVQLLLGADLDDSCLDDEVTVHFDVNEQPTTGMHSEGQAVNRQLLCTIIRQIGATNDECDE